ncbi:helix-turn-helix transcriptional regulator [uncultured Negativibacillus sp.]|uniref:helix-turn-helix domain-containing protein n=1 Tax=uncultured Negativibacillus sp. TaxID=1980696 RepID=UPI0025F41869|nr:helix-turn-helix transcriptional regulator [uncultured Negativibacillus sp.]
MGFKDRLKEKRIEAGLTQAELAERVSVTVRTIQNYEMGSRKPGNMKVIGEIAAALGTTSDYLLSSTETYSVEAHQKGGAKAARDIDELVGEVTGLFAGGQLSEDALEGAMRALNDAYWKAKEKNRKYTPKKYRRHEE